jgi:hypothetical protein
MSYGPPELKRHLEVNLDAIDAAVFSGDTFQEANARLRLRWYMSRWEREFVTHETAEYHDSKANPKVDGT